MCENVQFKRSDPFHSDPNRVYYSMTKNETVSSATAPVYFAGNAGLNIPTIVRCTECYVRNVVLWDARNVCLCGAAYDANGVTLDSINR